MADASLPPPEPIPVWRDIGATAAPARPLEEADVVIVGAGPVGLTLALDLGQRGHKVVVLNRLTFVAAGSKAICFAKRTLDIWDRLGIGEKVAEKGISWNVGKVFHGDEPEPIYRFDMMPIKHQKMPGFVNLQQYHVEEILVEALAKLPNVEIRWGHRLTTIEQLGDGVLAQVDCATAAYEIGARWLIACDGARSTVRDLLGLDFDGRVFEDNFLIADIRMTDDRPAERWFWFDPPFNRGRSALLHKQPDNVWRLDFQLGWNIDRAESIQPENVARYVRAMLGDDVSFEREWYSVYTFQCRRMARFVHGPIVFAGDAAHLVSPFGARGCNGGVADADNLGWKLDLVLREEASASLIESYNDEAIVTADANILNSSRSTDFMTPKSDQASALRDAVLDLATTFPFARPFVNSGRLSTAVSYPHSPLNTPDAPSDSWRGIEPGAVAIDGPICGHWLLERLGGRFVLLGLDAAASAPADIPYIELKTPGKAESLVIERFDLLPGSAYLIRPDHYVAARWRTPTQDKVAAAKLRAMGVLS